MQSLVYLFHLWREFATSEDAAGEVAHESVPGEDVRADTVGGGGQDEEERGGAQHQPASPPVSSQLSVTAAPAAPLSIE